MHYLFLFVLQRVVSWRRPSILLFLLLLNTIIITFLPEPAQAQANTCNSYPSPHQRMGVNVALEGGVSINDYDTARLSAGWYHDYNRQLTPSQPNGMQYHQMIRSNTNTETLAQTIGPLVDVNPGSIWAVGNEPDRYGQDEQTPAQYAVFYHNVYTFLKQRDPTSRVMAAAIVQATPIRLRYLSMVLAEYQQRYGTHMPVDLWSMHGFILPESCSWGAGLPPGLEAFAGEAVPCPATLSEHSNIETFKARVRAFRQWMKDNGYRDQPLLISEYGILLSKFHGFPYATVSSYMLASFNFLLNTTDSQTGMPGDGNRLVQEFSWFSLNFYEFNLTTGEGLNGNLFDHDSRQIKPLGSDFETYAKGIRVEVTDLKVVDTTANPAPAGTNTPVLLRSRYVNQGGVAAQNVTVRFWLGDPRSGGQLLGTSTSITQVLAGCHPIYQAELSWTPPAAGTYTIFTDFQATNLAAESSLTNNYGSVTLTVSNGPVATATSTPTPLVTSASTATPIVPATATTSPTSTPSATNTSIPTITPTPTATAPVTTGSISGIVSSERNGAALNRATVILYRQQGNRWRREAVARTNVIGQYNFTNRAPGTFRLRYSATRHRTEYFDNVAKLSNATDLILVNGGAINNINAALKPSRASSAINIDILTLGGQIVDAYSGKPIPAALVLLYEIAEETPDEESASCPQLNATSVNEAILPTVDEFTPLTPALNPQVTDADGRFSWETAGGCFYITVVAQGYPTTTSTVVGLAETPVELKVDLAPPSTFYLPLIQR